MNLNERTTDEPLSLHAEERIDKTCDEFEKAWREYDPDKDVSPPNIEDFLYDCDGAERMALVRNLIDNDVHFRRQRVPKVQPSPADYLKRFQGMAGAILSIFADSQLPQEFGRYRAIQSLGNGSFGQVFRAWDDHLERNVAIKVAYDKGRWPGTLDEARILSSLDHPNIVRVYDITEDQHGRWFIVSQFVDGMDLRQRMKTHRFSPIESAAMVKALADALAYAHQSPHRIYHRDIKPANILIHKNGTPYFCDFGLALTPKDYGRQACRAGTLQYMSPEQVRFESHLVDGRSDVFSLGVVFYELLTGELPFKGNKVELVERIKTLEPPSPRELNHDIPSQLAQICLRALSKRRQDRWIAEELAAELNHFLENHQSDVISIVPVRPKGLRSFSEEDKDFFLSLLPGHPDREGLPPVVRLWKERIEDRDLDRTFRVGVIFGPSGCGKSSLVKAGILPSLSKRVIAVPIQATASDTESRVLSTLTSKLGIHPDPKMKLVELLSQIREGELLDGQRKVLIVLDQFEQWLHARRPFGDGELVTALRQCDGRNLQVLILVRDDFQTATGRFLRDLDVGTQNVFSELVDLFSLGHARSILARYGHAFGALPEHQNEYSGLQNQFLDQAVEQIAENELVVCVRLILFAEVMKLRPWVPSELDKVGGAKGIGEKFLESTFSGKSARPEDRLHEEGARAVLERLLPPLGHDIVGQAKTYAELREAVPNVGQSEFDELIDLLDQRVRLITPTATGGHLSSTQDRKYQLTHDYLVRSIRDWLNRKQMETWRGRAEICLSQRSSQWNREPAIRFFPNPFEMARIELGVPRSKRTEDQRALMMAARRWYGIVAALSLLLFAAILLGFREYNGRIQGQRIANNILTAETDDLAALLEEELPRFRRWAAPVLIAAVEEDNQHERARLRGSLALLPVDPGQLMYLKQRLIDCSVEEFKLLLRHLRSFEKELVPEMWRVLKDTDNTPHERLLAACAVAQLDRETNDPDWRNSADFISQALVEIVVLRPADLDQWGALLARKQEHLLDPITSIFHDDQRASVKRTTALRLAAFWAADKPLVLAGLLENNIDPSLVGEQERIHFNIVTSQLSKHFHDPELITKLKELVVDREIPTAELTDDHLVSRAIAAIAMMRMGMQDYVWPLFRQSQHPSLQSFLTILFATYQVEPEPILEQLIIEKDIGTKLNLILCLSEYQPDRVRSSSRRKAIDEMQQLFLMHPDSGIHSASELFLRRWAPAKLAKSIERISKSSPNGKTNWRLAKEGHTMINVGRVEEFEMGIPFPPDHPKWFPRSKKHRRTVAREYAMSSREVTVAQFGRFFEKNYPSYPLGYEEYFRKNKEGREFRIRRFAPSGDHPMVNVRWDFAAAYCNWLSEVDGIDQSEWCYEVESSGIGPVTGYLKKKGYRLPTEAEWEYACRANTRTTRYYGESDALLPHYAWYEANSNGRASKTGSLIPNSFGLFDMLGNVGEWCHDTYREYPDREIIRDDEDLAHYVEGIARVNRGGSFGALAKHVRSDVRDYDPAGSFIAVYGFRIAQTINPN